MASEHRAGFFRLVGFAWILLSLLGAAWALSTPIGGAPDDPAHLIKAAAVARGELTGTQTTGGLAVKVPDYVAYSEIDTCFAFHPATTAACAPRDTANGAATVTAVTSAGLYNPLYYAMVGWPSLLSSSSAGLYGMRIVSAVLVALFLAVAFALVALWRRPTLPLIALATAVSPMVLFLAGNVNPNSLEIAATLTTFVGVLTILRDPARNLLALRCVIVAVSAAVAVNMRGLSLLWVALAILAPFVLASRSTILELLKTRPVRIIIGTTAVACIAAAIWLFGSNSLGAAPLTSKPSAGAPGVGTSHLAGFAWNLGSTFFYGQQVVGQFGWLDTPAPAFVYFAWSLLVGGLVILGIVLLRRRALIFGAILVGALLLLPPIIQGIYITSGGLIWQGRYILPVFACAVVGIGAMLSDRIVLPQVSRRRLPVLIVALWGAAQFLAFATTLKRYAVGSKVGWPAILHPEWSPPGGVDGLLAVYAVVLVVTAIGLARVMLRAPATDLESASEEQPATPTPAR